MNNDLPLVSVLIPVHPHKTEIKSAVAARQFDYPREKLEIVVVRTTDLSIGPGVKRNAGLKVVRGELVYFLDDDSVAPSDNLNRAIKHFSDPTVKMVGGPSICPPDAPQFERVLGLVMGSWLAFGPSCARYRAVGKLRAAGEKKLISCNLITRRNVVLEVGFDSKLWPNEENAMMDCLQKRGGKLLYDPDFLSIAGRAPTSTPMPRCFSFTAAGVRNNFGCIRLLPRCPILFHRYFVSTCWRCRC